MSHNSAPILVALSGSLLLVMMVSLLGMTPQTTALQADISGPITTIVHPINPPKPVYDFFTGRDADEIRLEIAQLVSANKPDEAKKLYDELYFVEQLK